MIVQCNLFCSPVTLNSQRDQIKNIIQEFSVCKGHSTIPAHEPRPFPSSDVISCMCPYKQFWQSGWPRCHSLPSPWSNSDAHERSLLHFPPVYSRLFLTAILWLSLAVWESWPHHHYLALLLTRWLTSAFQWSRCFSVERKEEERKEQWWYSSI